MGELGDINWIAVIVAVVVAQVIGFLWYGPLFGKRWMAWVGKTPEEMQEGATPAIVVGVISSVLSAVVLALLLTLDAAPDVTSGVTLGLLVSIGFAVTSIVTNGMFEGRNQNLMWLYSAYQVVSITVMGAILGAWT